jgi:hypothetical protein
VATRLRYQTRYRYPHGLVELHFFDCTPEDRSAEPSPEAGFRWVAAKDLCDMRFPEANEPVVRQLAEE